MAKLSRKEVADKWKLLRGLSPSVLDKIKWFRIAYDRLFYRTYDDEYYALGENSKGSLGVGDCDEHGSPTEITSLRGHDVVDIVCGRFMALALLEHGQVFMWGSYYTSRPLLIKRVKYITSISCAGYHAMALDKHSKMLIWGGNDKKQLGKDNGDGKEDFRFILTQLDAFKGKKIKQVHCSTTNSTVLLANGEIYYWGEFLQVTYPVPKKMDVEDPKAIKVVSSPQHLFVLTKDGSICLYEDNTLRVISQNIRFINIFILESITNGINNSQVVGESIAKCFYSFNFSSNDFKMVEMHDFACQVTPYKMSLSGADNDYNRDDKEYGNSLLELITNSFNEEAKSDIVFEFSSGEKIYAHRLCLRLASDYMSSMLTEEWDNHKVVTIRHHSHEVYHLYLKYLYTGQLQCDNIESLFALLDLAKCNLETKLENKCLQLLTDKLAVHNCLQMFEFAEKHSIEDLRTLVCGFIRECFWEIPKEQVNIFGEKKLFSLIMKLKTPLNCPTLSRQL